MATQQERERDRRSFQDLARLAGPPSSKPASNSRVRNVEPTSGTKDDSGLIDLRALAKSDPGAIDRASVTPLASAPLIDDEPAVPAPMSSQPMSQPLSSQAISQPLSAPLSVPAAQLPPVSALGSAPATLRSSAPEAPAKRGGAGRVAMVLGLAAIAAGTFVAVRVLDKPAPVAAIAPAQTTQTSTVIEMAPKPQAVATTAAPAATIATNANAAPTVDPSSLPKDEARAVAKGPARPSAHASAKEPAAAKPKDEVPPALAAAMAAETNAPAPPKVTAKDLPASPAPKGGLGDAIKSAAGPTATPEAPTTPAAAPVAPMGSVAQRPSTGAVQGALGAVLPGARACLGPDDPISRAHVVFGSNGVVQSVTVTGFAAGKPTEACIKGALGKARVPPFAEATFGATVTVRP